MTYIFNGLGI